MKNGILLALGLILAGCASTPPTSVHQPMTARPEYRDARAMDNGSIYQIASVRPLFEDRRARHVGDTLTINIVERNNASVNSASAANRASELSMGITGLNSYPLSNIRSLGKMDGFNLQTESDNSFSGNGSANSNNVFSGMITVTVIEVYPNGNLLVSGEKQVSLGQQQEFIRLSGVVNPRDIRSETTSVDSSRVADARIEYKATGYISEAQIMGWLARFFLSVLPF